eukprot:2678852-Prymnesium_polylepis.1
MYEREVGLYGAWMQRRKAAEVRVGGIVVIATLKVLRARVARDRTRGRSDQMFPFTETSFSGGHLHSTVP